jgi:hypothetical protein
LKNVGRENILTGDMKKNNKKSVMCPEENCLLNANCILLEYVLISESRKNKDDAQDSFHLFWSFNCQLVVEKDE